MNPTVFRTLRLFAHLLCASLIAPLGSFAATNGDDFDADTKNTTKWGADRTSGHGVLTQRNHRLEYTCGSPSLLVTDDSNRPWVLTRFPYNGNWEVQVNVVNLTLPPLGQENSAGITIQSPLSGDTDVYVELYSTGFGTPPMTTGFSSRMDILDTDIGGNDSSVFNGGTNSAVRAVWDSTNKVLTTYYDNDISDGYQWVQLASFGLAGAGGTTTNGNWNMTDNDQFSAILYGYSSGMTISSGQIHLDNFMETGGVTPNGQALPEPTGHFRFKFPTNNPLLTAIFNLTGRYTGVTPVLTSNGHPRNYTFDVVQDEAGKLTMTGMIDGVANSSGSSNLSGSLGSVTTVNNQPTVQFRNSFVGTGDGIPLTSRITGTAPIALTNIGGGSNALAVTASIVARVGGTPVHFRQMPILLPADESFRASAKKDWSLDLDLASKVIKNRTRTVASAQLLLPNGDTISFPERVVRYSKTRGYTLAFRRGTNITRIDRRSSITIVGLTFVKQGSDWQPTGGTIAYRFLGQKGTGQLTDFLGP